MKLPQKILCDIFIARRIAYHSFEWSWEKAAVKMLQIVSEIISIRWFLVWYCNLHTPCFSSWIPVSRKRQNWIDTVLLQWIGIFNFISNYTALVPTINSRICSLIFHLILMLMQKNYGIFHILLTLRMCCTWQRLHINMYVWQTRLHGNFIHTISFDVKREWEKNATKYRILNDEASFIE